MIAYIISTAILIVCIVIIIVSRKKYEKSFIVGDVNSLSPNFDFKCKGHITKFNMRTGAWIDAIEAQCDDGTKSGYFGGSGGGAKTLQLPEEGIDDIVVQYYPDTVVSNITDGAYFSKHNQTNPEYGAARATDAYNGKYINTYRNKIEGKKISGIFGKAKKGSGFLDAIGFYYS